MVQVSKKLSSKTVFQFLRKHEIDYKLHKHEPVYTVDEAKKLRNKIKGLHCKNLFLRDSKRNHFFLITLPADKKVDLKQMKELIGAKRLGFAPEKYLNNILGLTAGAVSPFGLINDVNKVVTFFLDAEVMGAKVVNFHPNDNSMSLELLLEDFEKAIKKFGNEVKIIRFTRE